MAGFYGDDTNNNFNTVTVYDSLYGGEGNDHLSSAKDGASEIDGGLGHDDIYFETSGSPTFGSLYGGDGNDAVSGSSGTDFAYGGEGDDYVDGNWQNFSSPDSDTLYGGGGKDVLYGRGGDDVIYGGSGDDGNGTILAADATTWTDGLLKSSDGPDYPYDSGLYGGIGNDTLYGGQGADWFIFNTALDAASNVDRIMDFSHSELDKIALSLTIFTDINGIAGSELSNGQFHVGKNAHDHNDHIIYNARNGKLFYDDDGKGGDTKVLFAVLDNHAHLHASDFELIA